MPVATRVNSIIRETTRRFKYSKLTGNAAASAVAEGRARARACVAERVRRRHVELERVFPRLYHSADFGDQVLVRVGKLLTRTNFP